MADTTNILYITNARIPTEKAHGLQIVNTVSAFACVGAKVRLVVPKRSNLIAEDAFAYYGVDQNFSIEYVSHLGRFLEKLLPGLYFPLYRMQFLLRGFFLARSAPEEVVYTRDLNLAYLLSKYSKKTVVLEDHEPKQSKRSMYAKFLKAIDMKIVVAKNLVELYESMGVPTNNVIMVPNGAPVDTIKSVAVDRSLWQKTFGIEEGKKVALYVGHFFKWKGVYTLIDAAKQLPEDIVVVLIGGTKEENQKVRAYVAEHDHTNVFVHDFMSQHDALKYTKSADVLVLPNTAKEERSASFTTPIKLFEYMVSGVPIVASRLKSFEGYIEDGKSAILVEPDNSEALARGIDTAAHDTELSEKIAAKAQRESGQYSWKRRAERIIEYINT